MGQSASSENFKGVTFAKTAKVTLLLSKLFAELSGNPTGLHVLMDNLKLQNVIDETDCDNLLKRNTSAMLGIVNKIINNPSGFHLALSSSINQLGNAANIAQQLMNEVNSSHSGAYQQMMKSCASVSGGDPESCGCSGGYMGASTSTMFDIQKYDKTLNAAAKEKIIAGVIDIMKGMGFSKIKSQGSRAEILESIIKAIPNREKNKTSFKSDVEMHKTLCKKLGLFINKHFTNAINLDATPEVICQQVSELLYSLFMGLHAEFIGVANDVRKSLMNLRYVKDLLKDQMDLLISAAASSRDNEMQTNSAKIRASYEILQGELERQMVLLQGLLNVNLSDKETNIAELLKEQSNIFGIIEQYDTPAGSAVFSDYLATIMTGVGITAQFARVVDDALKTVGMTLSQYVKDENPGRLFEELSKLIMDSKADEEKKEKMITAAEFLRKNFYQSKDIEKKIKEEKLGSSENNLHRENYSEMETDNFNYDSDDDLNSSDEVEGGIDLRAVWENSQTSKIDRTMKNRQTVKELFNRTFNKKFTELLDAFVQEVSLLVGKIGSSVTVSDQLEGLRIALDNIDVDTFEKKNMYLSLIGFYNDAASLQHRQTFIAQLDVVKSYVDTMLQMSTYSGSNELRNMSRLIGSIKSLLDTTADQIKERFGSGERVEGGVQLSGVSFADLLTSGDHNRNLRSAAKLKSAIGKFKYYYKAADIKFNLSRSSKEIDTYGENYNDILGSAIAVEIDNVRKSYYGDPLKRGLANGGILDRLNFLLSNTKLSASDVLLVKNAIKLHDEQMKARINLWRTIEAIDQYLRYFTKELIQHPEDVKDVISLIEDVSVISKWYDAESGDALCRLFDSFGSVPMVQANASYRTVADPNLPHYYERVAVSLAAGNQPGNPINAVSVNDFLKEGQPALHKAISNMKALKNLTAVFAYIGEKFGSSVVHEKTFMTPTQIYKSLLQYLECSAYMVGTKDMTADTVAGDLIEMTNVRMRGSTADKGNIMLVDGISQSSFTKEDDYFPLVIKSMCAKVLTVVGMFDLFRRPAEISYINPVRMILGAGDEQVKVETKAVELYVRLPLLVEFYRQLFGFEENRSYDASDDPTDVLVSETVNREKFAMLPEMDGLFGGIIRLIFNKNRGIDLQNYSDDDIKTLIREVNIIYAKMSAKYPSTYVKDSINELVQEVNRRYGLLKRDVRDAYLKEKDDDYDYAKITSQQSEGRDLDLQILPGESEYDIDRPAPSKKYERVMDPTNPLSGVGQDFRFKIEKAQQNLFYKFRCMLDNILVGDRNEASLNAGAQFSFKPAIKAAQGQLSRIDRSDERFKIVAGLIRGGSVLSGSDRTKYLLFHETVVSGLNVLSAIHSILSRVRMNVVALSVGAKINLTVDDALKKYFGFETPQDRARILKSDYWADTPTTLSAAAVSDKVVLNGLLSTVFGVSKDLQGLVEIKVDDRIYINWGGLKKTIEEIFTGVKYFLDLLRPYLDTDSKGQSLIKRYTDKKTPGSFFYLYERLVEQIILGRTPSPVNPPTYKPYMSLDDVSRVVNEVYTKVVSNSSNEALLGNVVAGKVFYDSSTAFAGLKELYYGLIPGINVRSYPPESDASKVNWLLSSSLEKLLVNVQGATKSSFPGVAFRFKHFYDSEAPQQLSDNRSLMFMLNQFIARYLHTFMDHNTNKIYLGCIDGLINGVFNAVITDISRTFPDCNFDIKSLEIKGATTTTNVDLSEMWKLIPIEVGRTTSALVQKLNTAAALYTSPNTADVPNVGAKTGSFTNPADPGNGQILFTSIAVMLYNIMTSKDVAGNPYYIERDLTAVPAYMKEKFRANMPGFANLFKELLELSELYRGVVNNNKLTLTRSANGTNTYIDGIALTPTLNDSVSTKKVLMYVLADITRVSASMFKTCNQIIREISDDPKHFETGKGSIEEFKGLYNKLPFMPVSNILYVLKNTNRDYIENLPGRRKNFNENDFLPFNTIGEDAFKLAYGTRGVISKMESTPSMSSLIGLEALINEYNMSADSKFTVSSSKASQFFQHLIKGVRYVHNVKNLKGAFVPNLSVSEYSVNKQPLQTDIAITALNLNAISMTIYKPAAGSADPVPLRISYALEHTKDEVVALSESSQVLDRQDDVVKQIATDVYVSKPNNLRVENILDMNIVPINVNAMMRELPLVNLYNYSYTFDRMIVELFYGIGHELGMDLIRNLCQFNAAMNVEEYNSDVYAGKHSLDRKSLGSKGPDSEKSSVAMFISLLVNPYRTINSKQSFVYLTGMFVGDQDTRLTRPKYLSDQVYGKALFGSLYQPSYVNNVFPSGILQGPAFNNFNNVRTDKAETPSLMRIVNSGWITDGKLFETNSNLVYLKNKGIEVVTNKPLIDNRYGWANVVVKEITTENKNALVVNSKLRLDTVIVRNLILIVNSYRALRLKIANDYNYNNSAVTKSRFFTNDSLTEFVGNNVE